MTAIEVNTTHNNIDDCITVSSTRKMTHIIITFNGKFMIVPMTVSLTASFSAALFIYAIHITGQTDLSVLARSVCLISTQQPRKTFQLYCILFSQTSSPCLVQTRH